MNSSCANTKPASTTVSTQTTSEQLEAVVPLKKSRKLSKKSKHSLTIVITLVICILTHGILIGICISQSIKINRLRKELSAGKINITSEYSKIICSTNQSLTTQAQNSGDKQRKKRPVTICIKHASSTSISFVVGQNLLALFLSQKQIFLPHDYNFTFID